LQSRGGLSLVAVSYRGVPLAMNDVIAGVVDLTFGDFSVAIPQMQGGTLRGLAVTSATRNELTPGLPALAEAMPGFNATIWYGLFAPAGTPADIVNKIHAECEKFLTMPATKEKLANVGVIVAPMRPDEFAAFVKSEVVRWTDEAKAAGIEAK
jgi:tripartite-type tricarboxylate transporter receptor subunit TctC